MTNKILHVLSALVTRPSHNKFANRGAMLRAASIACAALLMLGTAISLHAQIRSGTITGTVTENTGAVVPNADVLVTETNTQVSYPTKTNKDGLYTVPYLAPGDYSVSITAANFEKFTVNAAHLNPAQILELDAKLTVGATTSVVQVTASQVQLQTEDSSISAITPASVIHIIPNPTNNPFQYENLQSGISPSSQSTTTSGSFGIGSSSREAYVGFGVNGQQGGENNVILDGLPIMGDGYNDPVIIPNLEGIQSIQIMADNFSAEYGHGAGIASVTTKSGTNQFHGLASYENRNEALMANTAGNKMQGVARPAFKVDDIGAAVAGPILKDKLFFSSSFHWLAHNYGTNEELTVPTALERIGDFGSTLISGVGGVPTPVNLFNPFSVTTINSNLYQRAEYPKSTNCNQEVYPGANIYGCGDMIPSPSPYGLKILSYYPLPNHAPTSPQDANNYWDSIENTIRQYTNNNRVDYKRGRNSFYATGGFDRGTTTNPDTFGPGSVAGFNSAPLSVPDRNIYAQIGDTIVFSPTLIADLRYGATRTHTGVLEGNLSGFTSADYAAIGVNSAITPLEELPGASPNVTPGTWTNLTPYNQFDTQVEHQIGHGANASVTKIHGPWTFKGGFGMQIMLANFAQPEEYSVNLGGCCASDIGGYTTEYIQASGAAASSAYNTVPQDSGLAGALTLVNEGVWFVRPGANFEPAYASKYFDWYTQNDWKVAKNLTLNLGLRYELQPGVEERYNRAAMYDFTSKNAFGTMGSIAFPGTTNPTSGAKYGHAMWPTAYNNWTPHVGAAWRITPNLVARGGYGATYLPSNSGYYSGPNDYGEATWTSGNTGSLTYGATPAGIPTETINQAPPVIAATLNSYTAPQTYGVQEAYFPVNMKNAVQGEYNFTLEMTFGAKSQWLVSAGEVGSRANHLFSRNLPFEDPQTSSANYPYLWNSWRNTYISSNGATTPQTVQVTNPYQPTSGPLLPFQNGLANATLAQEILYFEYPLLWGGSGSDEDGDLGFSSYDSLQVNLSHNSSALFLHEAYTWSKNLGFEQSIVAGGNLSSGLDLLCSRCNRNYEATDVPNRSITTAVYQLPWNTGQRWGCQWPSGPGIHWRLEPLSCGYYQRWHTDYAQRGHRAVHRPPQLCRPGEGLCPLCAAPVLPALV